jgi:hypothetical protein
MERPAPTQTNVAFGTELAAAPAGAMPSPYLRAAPSRWKRPASE